MSAAKSAGSNWNSDLFKCFDNAVMCLFSWCVPCGGVCMQAIDAKLALKSEPNAAVMACLCGWCLCVYGSAWNRSNIRKAYSIDGSYIVDCLLHEFCGCCAATQEWMQVMHKEKGEAKKTICNFSEGKSEAKPKH